MPARQNYLIKIFLSFLIALAIFLFSPKVVFAQVVINEVYYQGGSGVEWIEIYNTSGETVDFKDWTIADNYSTDTLSTESLMVSPGSLAVVVGSNNSGQTVASGAIKIILSNTAIGNGLADDGDRLVLKDNGSTIVDQMSYGDDTSVFTIEAVAVGHSLERIPAGTDTNSASDFFDQEIPTPGSGVIQTPTSTSTPTPSPTPTPKPPTPTPKPPTSTPTLSPTLTPTKKPTPTLKPSPTSTPTGEILGEEETTTSAFYPLEATPEAEEAQEATPSKRRILPYIFLGLGLTFLAGAAYWVWYTKLRWPKQESS